MNQAYHELIHDRWAAMTEHGKLDASVAAVHVGFGRLRDEMRAKYNIGHDALRSLSDAEKLAVHRVKLNIVNGGSVAMATR